MKRLFDIFISLLALILLSPVVILIAFLVKFKLGAPIIFAQKRPGLNCQIFKIYKFRTMADIYDSDGHILPDNLRMTKFGRILRTTSLDELPGLWNVLNGEMSLVGPRPLLPEYIPYYTDNEMKRHSVKPGITGLAQVSGRNAITWEQKFALDLKYVDNISFLLDLKILFLTIKKVFKRENILDSAPQGAFHIYRQSQEGSQDEK